MTYFTIICNRKKISNLEVSEVLITYVTNKGKAWLMLHIGPGHSNNCQIILKLFVYDIFCNNLQHKKFQANLEVSEVLITYVTNKGKANVMLHIGAGHSNNCRIILKRNFNSCSSKTLRKRQKSHRINNLYATNKKYSRRLPIVPHCRKVIYNLCLECSPVLQMNVYLVR